MIFQGSQRVKFQGMLQLICGVFILWGVTGCTSTTMGDGKPVPDMTFEHIEPLLLRVASIDIINNYDPAQDDKDVSNSLPTPPDIILRRYAERKFKADDFSETLKFVIEECYVHLHEDAPDKGLVAWVSPKAKDTYKVVMKVRMYTQNDLGEQSEHSILTFRRSIAIPQSYSVAQREFEQYQFLELLMQDVDQIITKTLREKLMLTVSAPVYQPLP